jgi:hypothetical protein
MNGLFVEEKLEPTDNPNHLTVVVSLAASAFADPLDTGRLNDVYADNGRQLAARYYLWWE